MASRKATTNVARQRHRKGVLRAFAYGSVVGIACAIVNIRFARAEVIDQGLIIGRQMTELAQAAKNEALKVRMNGQEVIFNNQLSHDSPQAILDRYEALCRDNAAQSPDAWKALAESAPEDAAGKEIAETGGTIRGGSRDEGTVMCFVKSSTSKTTLGEALRTFQATGELGAIGQLRYAYVKKTKSGASHVLAMWTLDKFNIREMLPDDGDAPGEDFAELPRPDGSRRLFSTKIVGAPFGLNVYESTQDPVALANGYDQQLTRDGWFAIDVEGEAKRTNPSLDGVTGRVYEKDGILMTVVSRIEEKKTVTGIGIAGIPARQEASVR
jgi:hypothetical protein